MSEFEQLNARLDRIEQLALLSAKSVINIDEVSTLTSLSKSRIYHLVQMRKIPFSKPRGLLYFEKSKIEEWMLSGAVDTDEEISSKATTYCKTHK